MILKSNKIRDLGIESEIFVLRFKICVRGVAFEIRVSFLRFKK